MIQLLSAQAVLSQLPEGSCPLLAEQPCIVECNHEFSVLDNQFRSHEVIMKLVPVTCPTCSAPISLYNEQKHCHCDHCGINFVIDWSDSQSVNLTAFDTVLSKVVNTTGFLAADARLRYIVDDIAGAESEVNFKSAEVNAARTTMNDIDRKYRERISSLLGYTLWTGLGAAIFWFLVIFILEGNAWYIAIFIALILSIATWIWGSQWRETLSQLPAKLKKAQMVVKEAKEKLREAQMRLQDFYLEQEFCKKQAAGYRHKAE